MNDQLNTWLKCRDVERKHDRLRPRCELDRIIEQFRPQQAYCLQTNRSRYHNAADVVPRSVNRHTDARGFHEQPRDFRDFKVELDHPERVQASRFSKSHHRRSQLKNG